MFELVYDVSNRETNAIGYATEASYWPVNIEDQMVEKLTGGVQFIQCDSIHDKKKRYAGMGWTCGTGFNLSENSSMRFRMYVSHIKEFPNVFNQLQNMAFRAKQLGEQ